MNLIGYKNDTIRGKFTYCNLHMETKYDFYKDPFKDTFIKFIKGII